MKITLISTAMITLSSLTYAQNNTNVQKIMNDVANKYNSYKNIEAKFTIHTNSPSERNNIQQGTLFLNRAKNQYAILMNGQQNISNGQVIWNISDDDEEVTIYRVDNKDSQSIGPNNIFTFYQKGYKYRIVDNSKPGTTIVELKPIELNDNYSKIVLNITKDNAIKSVTIFDKSNRNYSYTINQLIPRESLPASTFNLDKNKYKNYYINDLR